MADAVTRGRQAVARADVIAADASVTWVRPAGFSLEIGNRSAVALIDRDRVKVAIWWGEKEAVSDMLPGEPAQTVSDYLLQAVALRRQLRYEEAIRVLLRGAVDHDLDPALRWPVLYELSVLLRLIRQDAAAERLVPLLRDAAASSADPAAATAAARLSAAGAQRRRFPSVRSEGPTRSTADHRRPSWRGRARGRGAAAAGESRVDAD